jgi:hypothetical protein
MDAETPEVDACPRLARACPRLARTTRLDSIPPIPHDSARPSVSRTPIASAEVDACPRLATRLAHDSHDSPPVDACPRLAL